MKKITPEEYEQWLLDDGRGITALEPYQNASTKIMHQCRHGHEWMAAPTNIKGSPNRAASGCPHCAGQVPQEYDEWLSENRPDIEALAPYKNASKKIPHACENGHEWLASPSAVKNGGQCPHCTGRTAESYQQWLSDNRPDITCEISEYVNTQVKITHRCSHGHEWLAAPKSIKRPRKPGCPTCSGRRPEPYPEWLAKNRPDMTVLEEYINADTRIMHRCEKHGVEWRARPSKIKIGEGCPECKADAARATHRLAPDVWPKWLAENRPNITMIGEYRGMGKSTLHRCSEGHEWSTSPAHLKGSDTIRPTDCPACCKRCSDNDAVYVYEIGDALGWTGLYKTGLTSWRNGDERIRISNRTNGTDYRIVALIRTTKGDAKKIEQAILDSGEPFTDLPDTFVDGRTEVRRFGPRAMETINQLAVMSGFKEAA